MKINNRLPILAAIAASSLPLHAATINLDLSTNNPDGITLSAGDNDFSFAGLAVDYLIVGGGGGGGSTANNTGRRGGGGGAGGLLQGTGASISGTQTITVGAGGTGGVQNGARGANGGNSSISGIVGGTAIGGGGGASAHGQLPGDGGSGGGEYGSNTVGPGLGTAGQGNNGGQGTNTEGGGGGGAGGAGGVGTAGAGLSSSITGSAVTYAAGGDDGGGTSGQVSATPAPAAANTGNGGNGITPTATSGGINGQAGGSGIVVVKYAGTTQLLTGGLVSTVGGNTVHTFTSTGASTLALHSATVAGNIGGTGNLVWDKTGTLTLAGTNSYTGTTTISLGDLYLSGMIGSTSDLVFTSGGSIFLGLTGVINVLQTNYSLLDANGDITGGFIEGEGDLKVSTFNDGFNDFTQISVIPEPSAALLGAIGGLFLLRRRRN